MDALRFIAGQVARFEVHPSDGLEGETPWYAIDLRFENGSLGRIDVLPTAGMAEETYDLLGDGFRASVTCPFGAQRGWRCYKDGQLISEEIATDAPEEVLNGCYNEAAEFIRALQCKDRLSPSIEDIFPSVELCWKMAKNVAAASRLSA